MAGVVGGRRVRVMVTILLEVPSSLLTGAHHKNTLLQKNEEK
jgi:hypothetical protein